MAIEIADVLINATVTAASGGGIEQILDNIIGYIFGGSAGVIAIWQFIKKQNILKYFNYNDNTANEAPSDVIKAQSKGGEYYKLTDQEKSKIFSGLNVAEVNSLKALIVQYESIGTASYTLETSKGNYEICFGFIDKFISNSPTYATRDSDGDLIGDAELISITSQKTLITDGITLKQSDYVGKEIDIDLKGLSRGDVVVGLFWDNKLFYKGTFFVEKEGTKESLTEESIKWPPYKSVFCVGNHILEVKFGYLSGYSTYNGTEGSSGDQTTWKEEETVKITVTVVE